MTSVLPVNSVYYDVNNERTNQKTITLSSLLELNPVKLDYSGLKGSISGYDNKLK